MLLLVLGLVGVTLALVRGSIFGPLQRRLALLRCARCSGWWVGLVGAAALERGAVSYDHAWRWVLVAGAVSLASTAADLVFAWIDSHTRGDP